jgi:hypothetical protein
MPGGGGRPGSGGGGGGGGGAPAPAPVPSPPATVAQLQALAARVTAREACLCVPHPPTSGRFVLSSNNGTAEWIATEEC